MTRGLNPLGALAWVREQRGTNGIKEVLAAMPKADIGVLAGERRLTSSTWVEFALQVRLLRAIDRVFGSGDLTTLFHVGHYMGQRDIPRVFRPLLRLGNPGWILEVSTRMWRYYHSQGYWETERTPVTVMATLHDHPECDEAFCRTFAGWVVGAIEISGASDVMFDHVVCAARGAQHCVFTGRWNLPTGESPESSGVVPFDVSDDDVPTATVPQTQAQADDIPTVQLSHPAPKTIVDD